MKQKEKNNSLHKLRSRSLRILLIAFPIIASIIYIIFQMVPFINGKINSYSTFTFFTVVEESNRAISSSYKNKPLYKGDKITGEFTASENNLGLVLVRLFNYNKTNSGQISFTLKEKVENNLNIKNTYNVDQFQPNEYFTFGFPLISNSKGKKYSFEITSLNGKKGEAISLSKKKPSFAAIYNFSGGELKSNKATLARFVYKKIIFALNNVNYKDIFLFDAIFILIVIYLRNKSKFNKQNAVSTRILKKVRIASPILYELIMVAYKKVTSFFSRLISRCILLKKYVFTNMQLQLKIMSAAVIFLVALLMRVSFYIDPKNLGQLIFYGIGGYGDYDDMFRHAINYMIHYDKTSLFWSFMNDFPVQIRLLAFFFSTFTFWKGINLYIYLMLFISSVVCLTPFLVLSLFNKRYSFGGFIASLLLATNQLSIWLASGRTIDTLTSLFFSLFIAFFLLALQRKNYIFVFLLAIFGFIDGLNRGLMVYNDWPALFFFGLLYSIKKMVFLKSFPFIHIKIKDYLYGFSPFLIYTVLFILWDIYFYRQFGGLWWFSPIAIIEGFYPLHNLPTTVISVGSGIKETGVSIPLLEKLYNFLFGLILAFTKIPTLFIPLYAMLATVIVGILTFTAKEKKQVFKLFTLCALIILSLIGVHKILSSQIQAGILNTNLLQPSLGYFLSLTQDVLLVTVFVAFITVQIILMKKEFLKIISIIAVYILALGYGLYTSFSERHYIQVLLILFILFGLTIDRIFDNLVKRKNALLNTAIIIYVMGILIYSFLLVINSSATLRKSIEVINRENQYLIEVSKLMPEDAIVIIGGANENPIQITKNLNRDTIYNSSIADAILIPHNKKIFSVAFSDDKKPPYIVGMGGVKLFNLLNNSNSLELKKYKLYVLDYDIDMLERFVRNKESNFGFKLTNKFALKKIPTSKNGRYFYKLELKR